jgi:molybdopterin synthase catalytic subunit
LKDSIFLPQLIYPQSNRNGLGGIVNNIIIEVCESNLDAELLKKKLNFEGCGAIVSFVGITRDLEDGERVLQLEFDAWRDQLMPTLKNIAENTIKEFGVSGIAIAHRVGIVGPQENIVAIHVCSAHRKEAFIACSHIIDELKIQAPLWKKEVTESGATWKEGLG